MKTLKAMMIVFALAIILSLFGGPAMVTEGRGRGDEDRSEFYGIIEVRPEYGLHGTWVISGFSFTTDARTEFDQLEGPLTIGSCAKVHLRSGRVHEIDSEPMGNCR